MRRSPSPCTRWTSAAIATFPSWSGGKVTGIISVRDILRYITEDLMSLGDGTESAERCAAVAGWPVGTQYSERDPVRSSFSDPGFIISFSHGLLACFGGVLALADLAAALAVWPQPFSSCLLKTLSQFFVNSGLGPERTIGPDIARKTPAVAKTASAHWGIWNCSF